MKNPPPPTPRPRKRLLLDTSKDLAPGRDPTRDDAVFLPRGEWKKVIMLMKRNRNWKEEKKKDC